VQYRVNFLGNGERSKPHGREWKYIMRVFGVIPKRTHNYDVTNTTQRIFRKFPVYCGCSVHEVTLKLINKIKNGKKYKCLKCKDRISLEKPLTSQLQSV
jgi:SprT protein